MIIKNYESEILGEIAIWSIDSGWVFEPWPMMELEAYNLDASNSRYNVESFKIQPYWGYPGWDQDVINLLRNKTNLPDSGLYALARAYANYQQGIIRPQFGNHTPNTYPIAGYERIDENRVREYLAYADSTLQCYRALERSNPNFHTIVGPIGIKCDNEVVNTAFMLETVRMPEKAEAWYAKKIYPQAMISTAENILDECPEGAILFTNGDNDTYPLWYVQRKYQFRTDVSVVNASLLNTAWYIEMVRDGQRPRNTKVLMSVPDTSWRSHTTDYAYIPKQKDGHHEPAMQLIWNYLYSGKQSPMLGDCEVELTQSDGASMDWILKGSYITRGHLAMLDIMATNMWLRPICYTCTIDPNLFLGLDAFLRYDGMIYTLSPGLVGYDYSGPGKISYEVLYTNMTDKFLTAGYDQLSEKESRHFFVLNTRTAYANLAYLLGSFRNREKLGEVEAKYRTLFPLSRYSISYTELVFARAWYEADDPGKGLQRLKEAGDGVLKELQELTPTPANSPDLAWTMDRIEKLNQLMEYAIQTAEEMNEQELAVKWHEELMRTKH